jgi:serine protease DegQ
MFRKLWLLFAQAVTVTLAAVFTLAILRPEWLPDGSRTHGGALSGSTRPRAAHAVPPSESPAPTGADRAAPILSYGEAAARATPSVVNIHATRASRNPQEHPLFGDPLFRRFFGEPPGQRRPAQSLGSGVIVSSDGHVLTNEHVVDSASGIEVLLSDGRRANARIVGTDPETDLAVLRIDLRDLPVIDFGDPDSARTGDVVLAIGNPFGVGQTVTMGIVSALGRSRLGINTFENFIQTDAAINPGNSGGALVDAQGRLLGINTAIYSRSGGSLGIGFAIPTSTARLVLDQIVANGSVTRGYIGVEPQDLSAELAEALRLSRKQGVIIANLVRGGPAERGGMRIGDVLTDIETRPITDSREMLDVIARLNPGSRVSVGVIRDGKRLEIVLRVGKRPSPADLPRRD